jgi:hypothetical protein
MSLALLSRRKMKTKNIGNFGETYRRGILEVGKQGGRIGTGENSWIGGTEQVDGSDAVDDRLNATVKVHDTKNVEGFRTKPGSSVASTRPSINASQMSL